MEIRCLVPIYRCKEHCQKHCYQKDGSLIYDHEFLCEEQRCEEDYKPLENRGASYE